PGSGQGFGALIDADIVFDDAGVPYIPAKRIKGCLLDAALEVEEMFKASGVDFTTRVKETFGKDGAEGPGAVYFSNYVIDDYAENRKWLASFLGAGEFKDILSRERVMETFTTIRHQTAIGEDGVAHDHSLRTVRILKSGLVFTGEARIEGDPDLVIDTLALACMNFRRMGTKRTRGFGEVTCRLLDQENHEIPVSEKLEALCTN
ncbi:MAG: hypothetical protein GY859_25950, partial [Desulfobacterales bacterium]|nr:hypothetical protein [Desulfobacterales bacterium]